MNKDSEELIKEINAVVCVIRKENVSGVRLVECKDKALHLDGYSNDLLFVDLKCGTCLVYVFNIEKRQFELWQGNRMLQQQF